ncbi:hypothetical protein [Salegentibacter maritimus]|uniref:Uncharacterized protein n=1 Tax=Salegentibacter maritimus TaxID=2794347 RepID=A0ABS0TK71_9FLAO|nr:hypothetical protein [Salegentibacter maritimus]MBI6121469.1 hypothetical protein [Salegentibacter maritimus]
MKLTLIITLLIGLSTTAQELTCADFKNGTFITPANEEVPLDYKIVRNGTSQVEISEDPNGILPADFQKKQYVTIEWLDDCSYRAKYDEKKMVMSDFHKLVNENNGILTEMVKIENGCFYYKSSLTINGKTDYLEGKMCLE